MSPQLGLVCITASKEVRYRTITRKRLQEHSPDGRRTLLDDIYRDNLQTFDAALRFCEREGMSLYRIPSSIFPFADEDSGRERLRELAGALAGTGERARQKQIRLLMAQHQLVHISSGRSGFNDRQHSDLISTMPSSYRQAPWIEIEAKHKEEAIRGLRGWLGEQAGA